ncbi:MAG: prepilin-type N-terminal cleavage/methylation domain-containing protein [Spirochaetes bacterium]|nr:prepilin-type N-terminal cleavage/methylation domain-containing protein [Spirochaetota bacterium]MBX3721618.1 prepilin-type N-terminal cleavage/methylation domain-containing protein [Turneriella sp.]
MKRRGFTLVELLIVIGLSGFIFTTLMAVYMQVKKLSYDQTRVASQSAAVIDFGVAISYDLENLIFEKYNVRQVFSVEKELHGGRRFDAFVFPSAALNANPSVLQARSFMVSYFVERNPNGQDYTLYRAEDMFIDYKNPFRGVAVPMLKFVDEFKVEGSNNGVDYEETWDYKTRRQIPRYIKITIRYRPSEFSNEISEYVVDVRPPILWN